MVGTYKRTRQIGKPLIVLILFGYFIMLSPNIAWSKNCNKEKIKIVTFIDLASIEAQVYFLQTHPNCRIIERLGDIVKVECKVKK